jgi:hypothetical protein
MPQALRESRSIEKNVAAFERIAQDLKESRCG